MDRRVVLLWLLLFPAIPATLAMGSEESQSARISELMKNKQYQDAIKLLTENMDGKPEEECGKMFLKLGECYYLTKQYENSRPCYAKALKYLDQPGDRTISEFRLACVAYRMKDYVGANDKIDNFVRDHPTDSRIGKLYVYKMAILSEKGPGAREQMEKLHALLYADIKKFGYTEGMEADQMLCEFFRKNNMPDKAGEIYTRIVHNFRNVISEYAAQKQAIPANFQLAHDNAALRLGMLCLDNKQAPDAIKWLENVRYDSDLKMKARMFMAQAAYQKQDYGKALEYLTDKGFLDTVPAGALRSDMHLILGMCEKANKNGPKVEEYLQKVTPETKGYQQAQSVLGDHFLEVGALDLAMKAYQIASQSSTYAAAAHFHMADICLTQAEKATDEKVKADLLLKAGQSFEVLLSKYPLSALAKEAKDKALALAAKGVHISVASGTEEMASNWSKIAEEKKGSIEAAQALMSLTRLHYQKVYDEKNQKLVKAPDYQACALYCDRLLDEKVYIGAGIPQALWKALRTEALYYRGSSELASASAFKEKGAGAIPTYLPDAKSEQAIGFLTAARAGVDAKNLEMVKNIELAILEALFKSSKKEDKEAAEKQFAVMENDYGHDARFQKLALDLADWYRDQGRFAEAASQYDGIAERGKDFSEEDILKTLHMAGSLYSRAASEVQQKQGETRFGICIYPQETVALNDDVLKTYAPFQKRIDIQWPKKGVNVQAREALHLLSRQSGIPFVWTPAKGPNTFVNYLEQKQVTFKDGKGTVGDFLAQIMDTANHRVTFDIGMTDGQPTLKLEENKDEPGHEQKIIEIYDLRRAELRYSPLQRMFGSWQSAFAKSGPVMLYNILARAENISKTSVQWAEGLDKDKQEKLAAEFKQVPGVPVNQDATCAQTLEKVLQTLNLRYRIVQRDIASEYYDKAKDAFGKIRKIDPKSKYGERALFNLAVNFYKQRDYDKMKVVLKEYLKIFDSPGNEFYRQACFWVGWALENENNFREASSYYARAAEERLVIYKADKDEEPMTSARIKKAVSNDTLFALMEQVKGELKDKTLLELADFIHYNTHLDVQVDPGALGVTERFNRDAFKNESCFNILCEALTALQLGVRAENVNKEMAEKAYYRLALVSKKDGLMDEALENCQTLLARFPQTNRKNEICALKLEIYKGLKDYRSVLATLEELKKNAGADVEKYKFELEMAGIYFDMCDYSKAVEAYKNVLAVIKDPAERSTARDAYARALFRTGDLKETLLQYEALAKEDSEPVRLLIDGLFIFYLKFALGMASEREVPESAQRFLLKFEKLNDAQREELSSADRVTISWIYYITGLIDLKKGRYENATEKLMAAANSPDDVLAGEAGYQAAMILVGAKSMEKAREALEYVLFSTKSSESSLRATFQIGVLLMDQGKPEQAGKRFWQIASCYPDSPYAKQISSTPAYKNASDAECQQQQKPDLDKTSSAPGMK